MTRKVFFSFHFDNDVMRTQLIRNIGVIEGNSPVSVTDWEQIKRKGDHAIETWIDNNMKYCSCVVVLVGEQTATRRWVEYEIKKAWNDKRGLLGIRIHNLKCPRNGKSNRGANPFDQFNFQSNGKKLSSAVKCYDPNPYDPYNDIASNLENWIEEAILIRGQN